MSHKRNELPSEWAGAKRIGTSGAYINLGPTAADTIVWHSCDHESQQRWLGQKIPNHTIVQREPLTIRASLACSVGCPWHGFVTDGEWTPA